MYLLALVSSTLLLLRLVVIIFLERYKFPFRNYCSKEEARSGHYALSWLEVPNCGQMRVARCAQCPHDYLHSIPQVSTRCQVSASIQLQRSKVSFNELCHNTTNISFRLWWFGNCTLVLVLWPYMFAFFANFKFSIPCVFVFYCFLLVLNNETHIFQLIWRTIG